MGTLKTDVPDGKEKGGEGNTSVFGSLCQSHIAPLVTIFLANIFAIGSNAMNASVMKVPIYW